MKTLKERLKYARELRGLSQQELATKAKCAQSAIGNVESGERQTLRNVVLVARVLGVSADWLFDGTGALPTQTPATPINAISSIAVAAQPTPIYGTTNQWNAWPFSTSQNRFAALLPEQRALVDAYLRGVVDSNEAGLLKKVNGD